tara:strand:- start:1156 stop:1629 length:474 start_codon:yes stop_codon:yes gene_type:complete
MRTKHNIKQRYKTVQGLRSFKDTLPTMIKKILTKKGEIYSKTLDNWKYLVGHELFKICYPKSFRKSNVKGKTLTIMVKHGYEVDVEYSKQLIIDKINFFFGNKIVQRIVIKTFDATNDEKEFKKENVTKNRFNKKIFNIKNKSIKKSLIELNNVYKK